MRDTIIFDFDGTLIDSAPGILATFAEVLAAAGLTPAVDLDHSLIGPPLQPTLAKLIGPQAQEANPALLPRLVEAFKASYAVTGVAHTPAYAGAAEALAALRAQGKTLYLATNKRASPTLALLDKFGWHPHFRRIYCIDSHQPAFSDKAAMLRRLLDENSLPSKRCLYVGDTQGDYQAAQVSGIDFLAALWGYGEWAAPHLEKEMLVAATTTELPVLLGPL